MLIRKYASSTSSKPSAWTLNEQDIPSGRLLFRLVPSERPTEGTGCGLSQGVLLPTPTSIDNGSGRINKSLSPNAKKRPTIALAAKMGLLPTPMSTEVRHEQRVKELKASGKASFRSREKGQSGDNGLMDYMDFHGLLPTPRSNKVNDANLNSERMANRGKGNLEEAVAKMVVDGLLPTPATQDGWNSTLPPSQVKRDSIPGYVLRNCPPTGGATSLLNPLFVQEMMGFPYLWTELPFQNGDKNP